MSQSVRSTPPVASGKNHRLIRLRKVSAVLPVLLLLGACGSAGLPFGVDKTVTASVPASALPIKADVSGDPSDWETVRRSLGAALADNNRPPSVDWSNPATGDSGTIHALADTGGATRGNCRGFATTLNDVRGVRTYRGEACRAPDGWHLKSVSPEDAAFI